MRAIMVFVRIAAGLIGIAALVLAANSMIVVGFDRIVLGSICRFVWTRLR